MIKIEKVQILGWDTAIHGMRNPMDSWDRSDSVQCNIHCGGCAYRDDRDKCKEMKQNGFIVGPNDLDLMKRLVAGGPVHAKFRRMITVYVDVTAPLYWWKEFDTYKVGTVANSCSSMHHIHAKEFTLEDFSCEHLISDVPVPTRIYSPLEMMQATVENLNIFRDLFLKTNSELKSCHISELEKREELTKQKKQYWWQMIQLLPSSYNQKRTIMLNYEVLSHIYKYRKDHKLNEWREFCSWIEKLPYSEIIIGKEE